MKLNIPSRIGITFRMIVAGYSQNCFFKNFQLVPTTFLVSDIFHWPRIQDPLFYIFLSRMVYGDFLPRSPTPDIWGI